MQTPLPASALEQLFLSARTYHAWQDKPVADDVLLQLYDVVKMGPTSMNGLPGRFVFVRSAAGKDKLRPALMDGNVEQTMTAPVTVIVAYDAQFYTQLPELFPAIPDAKTMFAANTQLAESTTLRNGSLQGAYLMLAARALGLDCGAISGFDNAAVDAAFFADRTWKSNFLVNLGYGDDRGVYPRGPRLAFNDACQLV